MPTSHKNSPLPASSTSLNGPDVVDVDIADFEDWCMQLLHRVHDQRIEVAITAHGAVVARMVPPDIRERSAFGFMRGTLLSHDDIVAPDFEAWGDLG